jgi:transglutaminase superfamily protein
MGLIVKDLYLPSTTQDSDSIAIAAVESDDWFLIRIRGAYAGFGRSRQIKDGTDWTLRDELNLSLNIQGRIKPVKVVSVSNVDSEFRLKSFELKVSSGIISYKVSGRMQGRDLIIQNPGTQGGGTKKLKLFERPRISRSLGLPVPLTGLETGDVIKLPIFDPLDGNKWDATIRVLEKADLVVSDRPTEAWRVKAEYRTAELTMWIDSDGKLLKGIMPLGITVMRSNRDEIASHLKSARDLPELLAMTSVPLEGNMPDPENLKRLKLKVGGDRKVHIPSDKFRQRSKDQVLDITREKIPEASYQIPYQDRKMAGMLAASRFIRSDHPTIVEKAREIVGNEKDPVKAAKLINSWVFRYLKKVPTPAVPDSLTVLQTRQGDCNEHAVLATALARALGIPARIAVGLVYANGGFFYHAWVEYWAGDGWFTGDPLMNQMPVDPSHIVLLRGDVQKHLDVIAFLGKLKFKVLQSE